MSRPLDFTTGSRATFAVRIAFLPDPDEGKGATREESLSWGAFEIWTNGQNLCNHLELGEPVSSVHWYLLPLLEWLVNNWDFLLHEDRLPAKNAGRDAWTSMLNTVDPPPGLLEEQAEHWETEWQSWWLRHCTLAPREGGLLPNVFIRRWEDLIEFSWGEDAPAGSPPHYQFLMQQGFVRLDPSEVASTLFDALDRASQHLVDALKDSGRFQKLVAGVQGLQSPESRDRRLGLLAGYAENGKPVDERWHELESLFPSNLERDVSKAIFGADSESLVVRGTCQAALMFGSVAPTISRDDARLLADVLVRQYSPKGDSLELKQHVRDSPVEKSEERAWRQGYRLAEELLEAMGLPDVAAGWLDIEEIYRGFGIEVGEIRLKDTAIRAIAIAGPRHKPSVFVNLNYQAIASEPRRFTLAHELCHLLHDRTYGAKLALASGPWAPLDVERRANAFAAMLLMPRELIDLIVRDLDLPVNSEKVVWKIANKLQTSFAATLEHLHNLSYLDEATRNAIRVIMETRAAQGGVDVEG
jgi:Zn-dependent peptidase ImmA (M78 family)